MIDLIISYLKIWILFGAIMLLTQCREKPVNKENISSSNTSDQIDTDILLSQSNIEQAYQAIVLLNFEKLINRDVLIKRTEDGYGLAKSIFMLNRIITTEGIQIQNVNNNIKYLNKEIEKTINLITLLNNDLLKFSQMLKIDWYHYYLEEESFKPGGSVKPEIKDIIFITHLLESGKNQRKIYSFLNDYFDTNRFLDTFFEEEIKRGDGKVAYMLDIQFEIYAKSKFYGALKLLPNAQLQAYEKSAWLHLLDYKQVPVRDTIFKESGDSTILGKLIHADKSALEEFDFTASSSIETWYLNALTEKPMDVCMIVDSLKKLNTGYYMAHYDAFEDCDCWHDYTQYMIVNSINQLALKIVAKGEGWPIRDAPSIDCLEALTDHYFEVSGEPMDFRYKKITPYFMAPYISLASENGSHHRYYLEYITAQVSVSPFMRSLRGLFSEYGKF